MIYSEVSLRLKIRLLILSSTTNTEVVETSVLNERQLFTALSHVHFTRSTIPVLLARQYHIQNIELYLVLKKGVIIIPWQIRYL